MKRDEIEKTKYGKLVDFKGNKNLLVSFGGIQQGLGIPVFEFFNSIADINCDKIFYRDFHQAWYQKGVDDELNHIDKIIADLRQIIKSNAYQKVCFLGNSMGGYASILLGTILNIDCVIAFAPQSFINKWNRLIYSDKRWPTEIENVYSFNKKKADYFDLKKFLKANSNYKTELNIYYSPNFKLDKKHSVRLKNMNNANLHPIADGGHAVVKTVRATGELKKIIQSAFY